jgi:hypothetical protein
MVRPETARPALFRHSPLLARAGKPRFRSDAAECLTTLQEYDNNGAAAEGSWRLQLMQHPTRPPARGFAPREDGMDFEKDNFEDDNELSRLEEEDELGGGEEIVETEEEEILITEEEPVAAAPAAKAAPKPAAKPAKKAAPKKKAAAKAKKAKPKAKAKAKPKKPAKKAAKKKKRR